MLEKNLSISSIRKYLFFSIAISPFLGVIICFMAFKNSDYLPSFFYKVIFLNTVKYSFLAFLPIFFTYLIIFFSLEFYKTIKREDRFKFLFKSINFLIFISTLIALFSLIIMPNLNKKLFFYKSNSYIARQCLEKTVEEFNKQNYKQSIFFLKRYQDIDKYNNARFNVIRASENQEFDKLELLKINVPIYKKKKVDEIALNSNNIKEELIYKIKTGEIKKSKNRSNSMEYFAKKRECYDFYLAQKKHENIDNLMIAYIKYKQLNIYDWHDVEVANKIAEIENLLSRKLFFLDEIYNLQNFPISENIVFYNEKSKQKIEKIYIEKFILIDNNPLLINVKILTKTKDNETILFSKYAQIENNKIVFAAFNREFPYSKNKLFLQTKNGSREEINSANVSIKLNIPTNLIIFLNPQYKHLENFTLNELILTIKNIKKDDASIIKFEKIILSKIFTIFLLYIYFLSAVFFGVRTAPMYKDINVLLNKIYFPFIFIFALTVVLFLHLVLNYFILALLLTFSITKVALIVTAVLTILAMLILSRTVFKVKNKSFL